MSTQRSHAVETVPVMRRAKFDRRFRAELLASLWCGAARSCGCAAHPGSGRPPSGYELFEQLCNAGTAAAYVDLDQLGLCHPTAGDDRHNHRLKARNLGAVWSGFHAAGAQCLVVSGLVDDAAVVRRHADTLGGSALTVCRLQVGPDELRRRIAQRGSLLHLTEPAVANAVELDRTEFADLVLDTAGVAIAEVAARVREAGWPGSVPSPSPQVSVPPPPNAVPDDDAVPVLWLCGPPAVGKSTIGFEAYIRTLGDSVPAAYIDLAQIGSPGRRRWTTPSTTGSRRTISARCGPGSARPAPSA